MKRYKDTPYFITEDGKVVGIKGYELKLNAGKSGYFQVTSTRLNKTFSVHRMVAETYIPNPENKSDVNHINGIKTDNRIENLEWVTRSENMKHSVNVLGKKYVGKLNKDDIEYNKNNYKPRTKGSTQVDLAKRFGVTQGAIKYFLNK